jgi:hypothetical protein
LSCQRKFFSFGARCPNPLLLPLSSAAHERERERVLMRETERHCALMREGERVLLRDMETDTLDSVRHRTHQRQRDLRDSSKVLRKDTGFALKFATKDVFFIKMLLSLQRGAQADTPSSCEKERALEIGVL